MAAFVDYAELKQSVSIEQVADWLGLEVKKHGEQLRGPCPLHGGGDRALVITPSKQLFYCFAKECMRGGDLIELVAKVQKISSRDAGLAIQAAFHKPVAAPQSKLPQGGLDYLLSEHEAVQALGLTKEAAATLGVGYAPKGILRGRVCFPLRDEDGKLIAYCGYAEKLEPQLKFPIKFL